jgi:peptidoglycan/xylan/chitin deacetylase (PgdA/CDA1 family)
MLLACLAVSCGRQAGETVRTPGVVVFTFDDRGSIPSWLAARSFFASNGIKATFFVDKFDALSPENIRALRDLASDGHEVGCHGFRHVNAQQFIEGGGTADDYIRAEILPALDAMAGQGFTPTAFAYPFGRCAEGLDDALLRHFKVLRNSDSIGVYLTGTNRVVGSRTTESTYSGEWTRDSLDVADSNGWAMVFIGHNIGETSGYCLSSYANLQDVCDYARSRGMRFCTLSEAVLGD